MSISYALLLSDLWMRTYILLYLYLFYYYYYFDKYYYYFVADTHLKLICEGFIKET